MLMIMSVYLLKWFEVSEVQREKLRYGWKEMKSLAFIIGENYISLGNDIGNERRYREHHFSKDEKQNKLYIPKEEKNEKNFIGTYDHVFSCIYLSWMCSGRSNS